MKYTEWRGEVQGETCRISVAPGMDVPMRADAAGGRFILVPFVQNEATEMQYGIAVCGRVAVYKRQALNLSSSVGLRVDAGSK